MEDQAASPSDDSAETTTIRCPSCDTLNGSITERCIGCGALLQSADEAKTVSQSSGSVLKKPDKGVEQLDPIKAPTPAKAGSIDVPGLLLKLATVLVVGLAIWTAFDLRRLDEPPLVAEVVTEAPVVLVTEDVSTLLPTLTPTPSRTPTPQPSATPSPTLTPTPLPTPTLQPPYDHTINAGEALFNIALRYGVSMESIIAINPGLAPERIVSGTTIQVPRPTATPPLVPVLIEVGDESLIADPTDCVQHEIQEAETLFGVAGLYGVPIDALLIMNRLSAEVIISPGDTVCIPTVIYNAVALEDADVELGGERVIVQPRLLYPPNNATISSEQAAITLQWVAERDLEPSEFYMVEITNLDDINTRPQRAFTQQTSFQIPEQWLAENVSTFRWRVRYVTVTAERQDGDFVYAFGGPSSEASFTVSP